MKHLILMAAAAVVISPALAADQRPPAVKRAPAMAVPALGWGACYVGGHGGAVWGDGGSDSGVFGGHIGCNYQISPQWVLGVEGDVERIGAHSQGSNWGASFRGRVGYAVGATLLYGTAGLALLDVPNDTLTGWTMGAGVEYAFAPSWTGRVEYRHTNFERSGSNSGGDSSSLRVGLSYRFGGPGGFRY